MPQWLLRLTRALAWRLLPREFRSRFGAELADTIATAAGAAHGKGGRPAQMMYIVREIGTFLRLAAALHRSSSRDELRWALRRASRQPVTTTTVILTLAATIAAVTTAFGLADAILWRPLPYADAERLVFVWERTDGPEQAPMRVTASRFVDWRASTAFTGIAIFAAAGFTLDGNDGATAVRGVRVSPNYFDILGVRPLLGRTFAAGEDATGSHQVIVLSNEFWRGQFGGDPNVVGREIRLSGQPYSIIGVMPSMMYPGWPVNPARVTVDRSAHQFWVPVPNTPAFATNARSHVWGTLARLAPGVTLDAAARAIQSPSSTATTDPHGATLQPLREQFVSDARLPLLLLLVAAAAVLIVACANLAAVQIASFETRRIELALRTALGANAARLARQLTFEALVQSALAGLAGITVTYLALTMIPQSLPPHIPFMTTPQLNVRVALFGSAIALIAGIALAAWPIASVLTGRIASRGVAGGGRRSVYRGLVVMQVAAAVGVVTAAALLVQSLQRVSTRDTGFVMDNIVVAQVGLPSGNFRTPESVARFEKQLRERMGGHAGVVGVALAYDHPLVSNWSNSYTLVGATESADDSTQQAELRIVSPSYFEALHVEVLNGRAFTDREAGRAPGVAVVNESLARETGGTVVGRRVRLSPPRFTWGEGVPEEFEIVGVVEDERFRGVEAPSLPALYVSTLQFPQTSFALLTATRGELGGIAATLRSAVRDLERQATVTPARALASIAEEQLAPRRVTTEVIGGLSGASLVLAALGVYGLLAVAVAARRREIGVRIAVGASPLSVGRHILLESFTTTAWGIGIGAALAFFASRLLEGMLVGVSAHDPLTFGLVSVMILLVAAGAALVPAVRAARTDPAITLRPE
jgi:putative ABC transport system permease protein